MKTLIYNARIVQKDAIIEGGCCLVEDGKIKQVGLTRCEADCIIDAFGNYLIPGFIDLHCHGGNGYDVMDANEISLREIANFHLSHGTTTMLISTLSASKEETDATLTAINRYVALEPDGVIKGVHLEGPWLNPVQCGAQAVEHMCLPDVSVLRELKARYPVIERISVAPELEGGMIFGKQGKQLGLVMSTAHTDADFDVMKTALKNGYTLITHLYSGMKGVSRKDAVRIAGAVEAGLYFDDYYVEVIADGKHLPNSLLQLIYKCKGANKICLITDATRPAGFKDGTDSIIGSIGGGTKVNVDNGVAYTTDKQSFAGSVATFDRIYRTMAGVIDKDMVALSRMSSTTPASVMGYSDRGEIAEGKRADMIIMDKNLQIKKIFLKGEIVL